MALLGTLFGITGFLLGLPLGLLVGYFLFVYPQPSDVKEPVVRPLCELDTKTLRSLLPDIPMWVKSPDYDRVDWLNAFISELWPYFDKAACTLIRSLVKPTFDEYIGRFHIESIEFEQLTLGSLPPIITGVKVYETQEKELIFEPVIRWASNSNIILAVKCLSVKVVMQLKEVQVSSAPRITLKPLVPTFPCFSNVFVSLLEKPYIDFGLSLLGADVMAIPGFYRFVQEMIKEEVSNLYHWPQALECSILEVSCGAVNKPVGILHVRVVRAFNLLKMDILGKSDPYVKLSLSGERLPSKKTSVKMCNLNPEWDENFKLIVKDPRTQVLQLHVYDWEKFKVHDKLGMQVVPLSSLVPHKSQEYTLDLLKNLNPNDYQNKKNRGKIVLELRFDPFREDCSRSSGSLLDDGDGSSIQMDLQCASSTGGVLSVMVDRAEDVEGKYHNNPYALILFRGEVKRTKRIKKSRDPRWNQHFQFVLEEEPVDEKLHIEVMSKKRGFGFFWKESLGHVDINLTDVVNNGRINQKYHLVNSRNGVIHIEITWRTI